MILSFESQIILYTALNLLSLYTLNCAINLFLKPKKACKTVIKALIFIMFLIMGIFTYIWKASSVINIFMQVLLAMMIMTVFLGGIKIKLVIALSWTTFIVICELIIGVFYSMFLGISLKRIVVDDFSQLIGSIASALVILIIIKAFQLYIKKRGNYERISLLDSLQVSIIPISSIFILYTLKTLSKYNITYVQWLVVVSILCIVFINFFFYYLFDILRKTEKIKYENKLLKNQSEYYIELESNINSTFDKIRTIKHDLSHNLLYLKSKLEEHTENSLDEANDKINLLVGDILSDNVKIYTKHQKLNRILNYKLFQAHKKGIDTEAKVNIREDSSIDESSLYIILGNAIDNAITNFNSSKSLENKISIRIFDDNNNLFIKITNPYDGKLIFKNGLPVTSKENKSMHGIGLRSIKKLVEDKNGYFKITSSNNIFDLEILLYNEITIE